MQWAWIRQATRQWISVTTRTSRGAANCDYNGQVGVYGTQGPPAVGIVRGSRDSAVMWVDSSWHFWLFGGEGLNASGLQRIGLLGTLNALGIRLSHRPMDLDGGGQQKILAESGGTYGSLGTPAVANAPPRRIGASSWTDSQGNFWSLGGNSAPARSTTWFHDLERRQSANLTLGVFR
jgi:hypothetical protein